MSVRTSKAKKRDINFLPLLFVMIRIENTELFGSMMLEKCRIISKVAFLLFAPSSTEARKWQDFSFLASQSYLPTVIIYIWMIKENTTCRETAKINIYIYIYICDKIYNGNVEIIKKTHRYTKVTSNNYFIRIFPPVLSPFLTSALISSLHLFLSPLTAWTLITTPLRYSIFSKRVEHS